MNDISSQAEQLVEDVANHVTEEFQSLLSMFSPKTNPINWALIMIPLTVYFSLSHQSEFAFVTSMGAIAPLAFQMGRATEEISLRTGESIGGLLNATFGNAVEMIIAALAIVAASQDPDLINTMVTVTQASLIGSILGNLLLVLGLAMFYGGIKHSKQEFSEMSGQMNGALLLLAVVALIVPSALHKSGGSDADVLRLSHATAVILLVMYASALVFQLKTHVKDFESSGHTDHETAQLSIRDAWTLLIVSTLLVSWMAHILVHSLESAIESWSLPTVFVGVVLLPFFGNAAEHFTAVIVAGKDKMDLSISIAIGSSVQIALFVAPLMVLLGWALGVPFPLEFGLLETAATFGSVFITIALLADGRTHWLEGMMALSCYAILAIAFFYA